MSTVVQTTGLTKRYGRTAALDEVDITVEAGQIYGLIGQNGAGKTTLIRLLTGLARPSGGSLSLFEDSGAGLNVQRRRIGALIESPALTLDLTAEQNIEAIRIQRGIAGRHRTREALEVVGLQDTGRKKVRQFSLGMRQRLGLGIALLGDPELLILDEPVNGLDPMWMAAIRTELVRRARQDGTTVMISSHLLAELDLFATHYGFIHRGRLLAQMSAAELHSRCQHTLRIDVADPAAAATVLEEELDIRTFRIADDAGATGGQVILADHLDQASQINSALVGRGVEVRGIETRGASLEEFFADLVKGA